MEPGDFGRQRRTLLKGAVLAVGAGALAATAQSGTATSTPRTGLRVPPPGAPGDFDFLAGEWRIRHRRLKTPGGSDWDEFDGEATCWTVLGGVGSVEELRIPARDFSGMGLRLLDLDSKTWSDYWVNAKSGALGSAGMTGGFVDGEGVFEAEETDGGQAVIARGVWDRIVPGKSHRWYQASSRDGGASWAYSWYMDWTRAG